MPAQSSMHFYFNWAKERIDEMDAVLASLEAKAGEVQAESRSKADLLIADLHKKRDEFQEVAKKQADAGEAAWLRTKANWKARGMASRSKSKNMSKLSESRSSKLHSRMQLLPN